MSRSAPPLLSLLLFLAACAHTKAPAPGVLSTPDGAQVTLDDGSRYLVPRDLSLPLPRDPGVRRGTLPNGLRWYVEHNAVPQDRVELRLVLRVGSVQEDEDQLGLAHLLEHMAFNGTEHFPGNTLVTYLESVGTRFGAHLNAHTSFEETVYKLQVPTEDELLDQGFLVLSDWAGGMALTDQDIEDERGVVLEEWRRTRGAAGRRSDVTLPIRYHGGPHAERRPIGTEESLRGFTPDAVRRFYADWYRPELMAVIVVGDLSPDDAQRRIEAAFSGLRNPPAPRPREPIALTPHEELLVGVTADLEERFSVVQLGRRFADREAEDHQSYRDGLVRRLLVAALNQRLRALSRDPEAGVQSAGTGQSRMTPTTSTQNLFALAQVGRELDALRAALLEVERVRRFGVLPGELEQAKAALLDSYRGSWAAREDNESSSVLGELLRNFTNGETVPGLGYEVAMVQAWVPGITPEEVNAQAMAWLQGDSRSALVVRPAADEALGEEEVRAVLASIEGAELEPFEEIRTPTRLVEEPPDGAEVLSRSEDEELGTVTWTLENGATVILKPTGFKQDEVRFRGWSAGGSSLASDADWTAASTATSIAQRGGAGSFLPEELDRWAAGKTLSVRPYIGETEQGVYGTASPGDLESALELMWLRLTAPAFTERAFALEQRSRREQVSTRGNDPDTRFGDAFNALLWQGHLRSLPPSEAEVEAMDRARSEAFFREAFGDIGAGTFVFVGAVDPETLEPLIARWIGTLPSGPPRSWVDVGRELPHGAKADSLRAGIDPKARLRLRLHGEFESTPDNRHRLRALGSSLSILLREELREERGGTYSVGARTNDTFTPNQTFSITIDFTCDPDRLDELRKVAWQILEQVRAAPVDASVTQRVAEQERRSWETEVARNAYWLHGIAGNRQREEDPSEIGRYRTLWERITPRYVHDAAQEFLTTDRYVMVTLRPEE